MEAIHLDIGSVLSQTLLPTQAEEYLPFEVSCDADSFFALKHRARCAENFESQLLPLLLYSLMLFCLPFVFFDLG